MANEEHLALLKQGAEVWNAWRSENPNIRPDLGRPDGVLEGDWDYIDIINGLHLPSGAELKGANLSGADLTGANLSEAGLGRADLSQANLSGAFFDGANLWMANLSEADLTRTSLRGANLSGGTSEGRTFAEHTSTWRWSGPLGADRIRLLD